MLRALASLERMAAAVRSDTQLEQRREEKAMSECVSCGTDVPATDLNSVDECTECEEAARPHVPGL